MSPQTEVELEQRVRRAVELLDAMDTAGLARMITDDAQGIDEISQAWMRGRAALERYFGELEGMVDELHTEIRDLEIQEWGDAGVATCVLRQTYRMGGEEQHIAAPSTIVFRREGADWRIVVFHSAPLPQQPPEDY